MPETVSSRLMQPPHHREKAHAKRTRGWSGTAKERLKDGLRRLRGKIMRH